MMKIPGILLSITALGSILWVHSAPALGARAWHFRLSVPVHIERIPNSIPRGILNLVCGVGTTTPGENIGFSPVIPIYLDEGGNYRGTINVSFDAHPGKDPALANHYTCGLRYGTVYDITWLSDPQSTGYMKEFDYRDYEVQIWKVSGPIIGRKTRPSPSKK